MDKFAVKHRVPSVQEYLELRETVGWKLMSEEAAAQGLSGPLFAVCIEACCHGKSHRRWRNGILYP